MDKSSSKKCVLSFFCSLISIGAACTSLLSFNAADRVTVQKGAFLTCLGFCYFISLTDSIKRFFFEAPWGLRLVMKYQLRKSEALNITNKVVSIVQATLSSAAGCFVCNFSCNRSFLRASHFITESYAWFGAAYFYYDIWSMYIIYIEENVEKLYKKNDGGSGGKKTNGHGTDKQSLIYTTNTKKSFLKYLLSHQMIIFHHLFIGSFGLFVISYLRKDLGDCVFSLIFIMELSTPFVSFRSILSTLKMKTSQLYKINGICMIVVFFFCRILMWPYAFHWYSLETRQPFVDAIVGLPRGCKISISFLFLPQLYWFYLMVRGAVKVFMPKAKGKHNSKTTDKFDERQTYEINGENIDVNNLKETHYDASPELDDYSRSLM